MLNFILNHAQHGSRKVCPTTISLAIATIFLLISYSCGNNTNNQLTYLETSTKYVVAFVDDFSSTRKGAQHLQKNHLEKTLTKFQSANIELTLYASHVTQPRWNPIVINLSPYTRGLTKAQLNYTIKKTEADSIQQKNKTSTNNFLRQFEDNFLNFELTNENDYSYIESKIRAISRLINSSKSNTHFIVAISSDMIEHQKREHPHPIDSTLVQTLDTALDAANTHLYIIGDDDFTGMPIENLRNKHFLSSWTQFEEELSYHLTK